MRLSLWGRLFVAQTLLVAAALAIVSALALVEQRRWVIGWHVERLERAARAVEARLEAEATTGLTDAPGLAERLGSLLSLRVTLIDARGAVRGDSEVPRDRLPQVENHAGRPEVREAMRGRVGHAARVSATVGREFVYVAVPARASTGLAVVRVAEPMAEIAQLRRSLLGFSMLAAVLALFASVPLALWVARAQVERVRSLEAVAAQLGAGKADVRARERPGDEVGRLGAALNRMASELRGRLEALERERDERELILAHMSDGVALVDREGRVAHVNRSFAAILGEALPPAAGTPLLSFARAPEVDALMHDAREAPGTIERDLRVWAPEPRVVRATATRLGGSVLLVLHDLTEIERLNRVRQDFVANVSHELKTPLTSLRGYAETLLDGGLDDLSHREEFVRVIRDQAKRLQALVEDLLSLADLERPDTRMKSEPFDLREAAETQVAQFRERARQASLALSLEPGPPARLEADRVRIDQVIANLLDNALKYTERGRVTVALGSGAGHVWCEVRDTGPGIAAEHQDRVFERFYRVDPARSRERGGTGLGLSIVKHIVELHGGTIGVMSWPGRGATFRFELPQRSERPDARA